MSKVSIVASGHDHQDGHRRRGVPKVTNGMHREQAVLQGIEIRR